MVRSATDVVLGHRAKRLDTAEVRLAHPLAARHPGNSPPLGRRTRSYGMGQLQASPDVPDVPGPGAQTEKVSSVLRVPVAAGGPLPITQWAGLSHSVLPPSLSGLRNVHSVLCFH